MSLNQSFKKEAIDLLKTLIATPSFSREEAETAELFIDFFKSKNIPVKTSNNNIWVVSKYWQNNYPTILLNSHHDTVKPVDGWQRDPFEPKVEKGKLYGLGSNDAGASLVALAAVFLQFYEAQNLPFNLVFLASAEEEVSGKLGVESVLPKLGTIDFGIVGEPTQMQMAVAEKGLIVIDGKAHGKAGHAARKEGENAIYTAMKDIDFLKNYQFEKSSELLGPIHLAVTQIQAGTQHNVVPDSCQFVIDVRTTESYSNQEVLDQLQDLCTSTLTARSLRLQPSGINLDHPLIQSGHALGLRTFGSATLSDQALMSFPTLKIGPGDSKRSHTADEYILLDEIEEGIHIYYQLLQGLIPFYKKKRR